MANKRALDSHQLKMLTTMYVTKKMSSAKIAKELGVNRNTVLISLRRLGIEVRPIGGKGGLRGTSARDVDRAVQMYAAGEGCEEVATKLGTTPGSVLRWARAAGVNIRPKGFQRGEAHHAWLEGRVVTSSGYINVLMREDDPLYCMAQEKAEGVRYAPEHRIVMARHLGRPLRRDESVHHVDGNRQNNAIKNLQLRQGRHGKGVAFRCADCGSRNVLPDPLH